MSTPPKTAGNPEKLNTKNGSSDSFGVEVAAQEIRSVPPTSSPQAIRDATELTPFDEIVTNSEQGRSRIRVFAIMTALFSTLFISALNATTVGTAVPTICAQLHSASGYSWIGGAYVLANAAAAPIWAKLSDIWGRKIILLVAVASYFFSSIICATSISMKMLIIGRAMQGTASGGLIQLVMITISDLFSIRKRSLYFGLTEVVWALAAGVGPVLGGALTQYISWRWIFWINLPICGLAFSLILFFLDVHNPRTKMVAGLKAIDWFGSISILGLMVMLLLGLNFGGEAFPWNSPTVICLIVFGALMSVFFVFNEKSLARYPLIPLGLFKQKSNIACLAVGFAQEFVVIATDYYLPLYFQSAKEASPLRSGTLILPITITEACMAILTGITIHRTGHYLPLIWAGVVLSTIGNGLFIHLGATSPIGEIFAFEVIAGLGAGLLFEPPLIALQALVSQDNTATATATLGFIKSISTSLSIIIGGVIFQNGMKLQVPKLEQAGLSSNDTRLLSGDSAAANVMIVSTLMDAAQKLAVKQAFASSLRNVWIMVTSVGACGIIASAFIAKAVLSKEHVETKTGLKQDKKEEAGR